MEKDERANQSISSNQDKNQDRLINRFFNNALIDKYDVTSTLLGQLFWPLTSLLIAFIFYSDISTLIGKLSSNLSRTSRINIAGIEIEVYEDSFRGSDIEAYRIIGLLSREELLYILERGEIPFQVNSSYLLPEDKEFLEGLERRDILTMNPVEGQAEGTDVEVSIQLTDLGVRIYEELQKIVINFVEKLPSDTVEHDEDDV